MAFFHEPIRMFDTLLQNMCSFAHATSSSTNDYDVTD